MRFNYQQAEELKWKAKTNALLVFDDVAATGTEDLRFTIVFPDNSIHVCNADATDGGKTSVCKNREFLYTDTSTGWVFDPGLGQHVSDIKTLPAPVRDYIQAYEEATKKR